jgi:hypothetical protein
MFLQCLQISDFDVMLDNKERTAAADNFGYFKISENFTGMLTIKIPLRVADSTVNKISNKLRIIQTHF